MTAAQVDARRRVKGMIRVPGGSFLMGSQDFYPEERPVRRVEVDAFWMDDHPVTVAEFRAFVKATGYVTMAERPLDPAQYPGADPELLRPGSLVFYQTDRPVDRKFRFEAPWADVKAHLLAALATALRCQCVQTQTEDGPRLHVFGYSSDLERAEILFTSLLVQMARPLAKQAVPAYGNSAKAWRRSWMLGYCAAVVARVRATRA